MRRGFKSWAEAQAAQWRAALQRPAHAPLPAKALAAHLEIVVIDPTEIPGITPAILDQLLCVDPSAWSAVTIVHPQCTLIVHNTAHVPWRQESDLMHELAHRFCEHQPVGLVHLDGLPFPLRSYKQDDEDEAAWLGSCLQLPRPALWWAVKKNMDHELIMEHFVASDDLVRYRRRVTAVDVQLARMRRRR